MIAPLILLGTMEMAFNYLLWYCLVPDKTSHAEEGRGVEIGRRSGETILLFTPDDERVRETTRKYFGVPNFCDVIVFYKSSLASPIVFFVELKGTNIGHAITQIESAVTGMTKRCTALKSSSRLVAIIVSTASSPALIKAAQKRLSKTCQVALYQKTLHKSALNLRDFV